MAVGLLDIGPLLGEVTIRDNKWTVQGLSALGLFDLLEHFPELRKLLSEAGVSVQPKQLFDHAPGAIATTIVYCLGYRRGDPMKGWDNPDHLELKKTEEFEAALIAATNLSLGEQTEIIKKAWDLTFPKGTESFLEALEAVGAIESGKAQATQSRAPSSS